MDAGLDARVLERTRHTQRIESLRPATNGLGQVTLKTNHYTVLS
jgi:hypothetical protein